MDFYLKMLSIEKGISNLKNANLVFLDELTFPIN